ncbi:MAG: arylamine N-acetyltransferase, partial [Firmicutes bacterium]|nr:arylamine N-acetyltransferase [Bacillota bacterium]
GKTHMVVLVEVDNQKWICDVGFGGNGLVAPIRFEEGLEQEHFYRTHRVMADLKYGYRLEFKTDGEFLPIYAFTLEECCPADYLIANHYTSTYPASFFTQLMMCSLSTDVGRITYLDGLLKIINSVDQDAEIEKKIVNDDEIREVLKQYFGIQLLNDASECENKHF